MQHSATTRHIKKTSMDESATQLRSRLYASYADFGCLIPKHVFLI